MPVSGVEAKRSDIKLIHYNLAYKPWHFEDILYKDYFWDYAKETPFFDKIMEIKENYTEEDRFNDMEQDKKLKHLAKRESDCVGDDRKNRH